MATIKGQNLRLFVQGIVVGYATTCQAHVSAQLSNTTTKDDTDDWANNDVTGLSWDVSSDALVGDPESGGKTYQQLLSVMVSKTKVSVSFSMASGSHNATEGSSYLSGQAYITDIQATATNRENSTFTVQLTGTGPLTTTSGS